ncbi:hypothetical protein LPW26_14005 [Rhodopseudomonas sp. HC1]|uniref:hypothetical protein n=1 Tax=Rhodopseudomonas infernalis TaxID=2897386 RepID=UPI001EE98688|nr:hypothetical protein [Rhodopseudomonas infernalis]MCG6205762.1 hypothetical protein [Rhodopseudomonas infernalis]
MVGIRIDQDDDIGGFGAAEAVEAELIEPVPVMSSPSRTRYTDRPVRPSANFIAQLLAIEGGYPQTRGVFRAEPDEATAAYRSAPVYAAGRTRRMS